MPDDDHLVSRKEHEERATGQSELWLWSDREDSLSTASRADSKLLTDFCEHRAAIPLGRATADCSRSSRVWRQKSSEGNCPVGMILAIAAAAMIPTKQTTAARVDLLRNCQDRAGEMIGPNQRSRSGTSWTRSIRMVAPRQDRLVASLNFSWTLVAARVRAASDYSCETIRSRVNRCFQIRKLRLHCLYERIAQHLVREPLK